LSKYFDNSKKGEINELKVILNAALTSNDNKKR